MKTNLTIEYYRMWHLEHYGTAPPMYLMEKHEFKKETAREVTDNDWVEFWSEV